MNTEFECDTRDGMKIYLESCKLVLHLKMLHETTLARAIPFQVSSCLS